MTSIVLSFTLTVMNPQDLSGPPEEQKDPVATPDGQPPPPQPAAQRRSQLKYIILMIVAVLVMVLVTVLVQRPSDPEEYLKTSGYIGVFAMAIIGSTSPVWPLPGSWAAFIAAGLGGDLNPLYLGLLAGVGEAIGELSGYTAGFGGQVGLRKFKKYRQIENWMRRWGGRAVFLFSVIPNFFIKAATIAAGGLRYPIWRFFIFCWAGKTIKDVAFAYAGYGLFDGIERIIDNIF